MDKMDARSKKVAFATAIMVTVNDMLGYNFLMPMLVPMSKYLGASNQQTGMFGFVRGFFLFFSTLTLPVISDRTSRRFVILLSVSGSGFAYFFQAIAPSFKDEVWFGTWNGGIAVFMLGRAFAGFFGGSGPVLAAFVSEIYMDEPEVMKQRMVLLQMSGQAMGLVLAPAAGFIASFGLVMPYWVSVFFSILILLWCVALFPAGRVQAEGSSGEAEHKEELKNPCVDPAMLVLTLAFFVLGTLLVGAHGFLLPNMLFETESFGLIVEGDTELTGQQVSQALGFMSLPQGIGNLFTAIFIFTKVTQRFGESVPLFCTGIIMAVGYPLFGLATKLWHLYLLQGAIGMSFGMAFPAVGPMMARYAQGVYPAQKAQLQGMPMMGISVGLMLGMNTAALLQDSLGLRFAWTVCGVLAFVAGCLLTIASVLIDRVLARQEGALAHSSEEEAGQSAEKVAQPVIDRIVSVQSTNPEGIATSFSSRLQQRRSSRAARTPSEGSRRREGSGMQLRQQ